MSVLSKSPSPSFCAVHASPGPFLKANFPHRWSTTPLPTSRSDVIEIEMLFPSFSGNLCCSALVLQTSPVCYSIYLSSLFLSHWLLMCLPSNLLLVNRPPTKDWKKKRTLFFPSSSIGVGNWMCVRSHYALAHKTHRDCQEMAVFNQMEDVRWDDYSRLITSQVSNRTLIWLQWFSN